MKSSNSFLQNVPGMANAAVFLLDFDQFVVEANAYSHNDPDPFSIINILLPNQCQAVFVSVAIIGKPCERRKKTLERGCSN